MLHRKLRWFGAVVLTATACGSNEPSGSAMGSYVELWAPEPSVDALSVCASGATVNGIDVSVWNGTIDWAQVAGAGVGYSFIRVSDGLDYPDTAFARNWNAAKTAGVRRGAYQFFRSNEDPIEQAQFFLNTMGPLLAGDLPPVIDVETADGQTGATIAANVRTWIDHVEGALGVAPIIYTAPSFWSSFVDSDDFVDSPLWIAHWGVSCPTVPSPWTSWALWQKSATGTIAGINGSVDLNVWNGGADSLASFAFTPVCGDGFCNGGERHATCSEDCAPCQAVQATGARIIDDTDECFTAGGPQQYIRVVGGRGYGGGYKWTRSYVSATTSNYGLWELAFEAAGLYRVEAYCNSVDGQWSATPYQIQHGGTQTTLTVDQTDDGWVLVGELEFAAGGDQFVRIDDNVASAADAGLQIVFDALRVTPLEVVIEEDGGPTDADGGDTDAEPTDPGDSTNGPPPTIGELPSDEEVRRAPDSCASSGSLGAAMMLVPLLLLRRRSRSPDPT